MPKYQGIYNVSNQEYQFSKINDLKLDNIQSQSVDYSSSVTKKAIEDGLDITDHIHLDPKSISLSVILKENYQDKKEKLRSFRDNRELVKFKDEENAKVHLNLAIVNLNCPENVSMNDAVEVSIELQQVSVVNRLIKDLDKGTDPSTGEEVQTQPDKTRSGGFKNENIDEETAPTATKDKIRGGRLVK